MGLDPDKFDINAFDKNGAGMYIKPQYQTQDYKKKAPQISLPPPDTSSTTGGTMAMTGAGQQMTGGINPMQFSGSTNQAVQDFQKQIDDEALFSQMDKDLGLDDQTFAEMDAIAGGKQPEDPNKEWNDNLIPSFSKESRFQSNEDDGNIETGAKWLGNAGMSLWNIVSGVGNAVVNPYDTTKAVGQGVVGTVQRGVANASEAFYDTTGYGKDWAEATRATVEDEKNTGVMISRAITGDYAKTYGSVDGFKDALWNDPARIVGDVLTVVSGGAGAVSKISQAQKAKLISQVRLATTLEQKSALIQNAVRQVQYAKTAQSVMNVSTKINPYIFAPKLAYKGGMAVMGGIGNTIGSTVGF